MAVVAVGAIMRGSGVGMPSSRGEHVSLYLVVRWASMLTGLQEKEMEVSDDTTTKFSTGSGSIHKVQFKKNITFHNDAIEYTQYLSHCSSVHCCHFNGVVNRCSQSRDSGHCGFTS